MFVTLPELVTVQREKHKLLYIIQEKNYMEFMLFLSVKTSWQSCMDIATQQTARHNMEYLICSLTERGF